MSTLTSRSSPSPAPSPRTRASSHIFAAPQRPSSRSPRPFATSPSPIAHMHTPTSVTKPPEDLPQQTSPESTSKPRYTDAATQYTPDGLPPTARELPTSEGPITRNKRKQSSPLPVMASYAQPPDEQPRPPPEPQPQEKPEAAQVADTSSQALPERPAVPTTLNDVKNATPAATKRARTGSDDVKIMPARYETCNPKDLGVIIANMLMELIRLNDTIPLKDGKLTRFHSRAPPGISCHDYLLRLIQHATLSPPILLSMVYYIDRLCALYPAFTISSLTVHRFLITAATVAAKGLSDSFWTNPVYARIGGISISELATLELDFLQRVEWRIVPKPETLVEYYMSLVQRSEGYEVETIETQDETMREEEPP